MAQAYVMVVTAAGTSPKLLPRITALDHVTEAHVIAGDFDVMVEAEAEEMSDIMSVVTHDLQQLDGVGHTRTYVVLE